MNTQTIPEPLKDQVINSSTKFTESIAQTPLEAITEEDRERWVKVLVCSDYVERQLDRQTDDIAQQWLKGLYHRPLEAQEMAELLAQAMGGVNTEQELYRVLRQFRNQQMVRITWRDINGLARLNEVLSELTELANCCIRQSLHWLEQKQ